MFLHNSVTDAQSQARTFSHGLRREEWVEYLLWRCHTRPRIRKLHNDSLGIVIGVNRELAAADFVKSVNGIAHQVEAHLQELIGVATHLGQVGIRENLNVDLFVAEAQIVQV